MNEEAQLLTLYLDGELSPQESAAFRARLLASPSLRRRLADMRHVGSAVRAWADEVAERAAPLLEPTLARARAAERPRNHGASLAAVAMALLLLLLPASARDRWSEPDPASLGARMPAAAIQRLEAGDRHAQVFVVGSSRTPVVWLADEAVEDEAAEQLGPG